MDLRNNTIFGWTLGAGIVALGLGFLSSQYFQAGHPEAPEKPGYVVVGEASGDVAAGPSLNTLLASADVAAGEQVFKKCTACHTVNQGGANGIGPNLWAIVGDPVAHGRGGFAFSDALKTKGGTWDFAALDEWFKSPNKFAAGTKMSFAGLGDPKDRANLIAWLNTQGSNKPLPAADAPAEEGGDAAAPADGEAKAGEAAPAADAKGEAAAPEAKDGAAAAPAADAKAEAAPAEKK
ncbi:cytochrome c family protein [Pseudonocardia sp. TMWB2A]|uniref:c-type cytochrome n=1 Tax=Pseudonocardia sp. TMWB2A TaxID=687430 RepID=UPI00307CC8CC